MKCLDLFSGTRSIAKAFEIKGFETFTIELDRQHKNIVLFSFLAVYNLNLARFHDFKCCFMLLSSHTSTTTFIN